MLWDENYLNSLLQALWIDNNFRIEWDEYDLYYNKLKIEVKSCSYIQSWEQEKYSNILFTIKPTNDYNWINFKRQSDLYIFAILSHKDASTIDPLKLEQWDFYIIRTSVLNEKMWTQKTIWLNVLLKLNPIKCNFQNLKQQIDFII